MQRFLFVSCLLWYSLNSLWAQQPDLAVRQFMALSLPVPEAEVLEHNFTEVHILEIEVKSLAHYVKSQPTSALFRLHLPQIPTSDWLIRPHDLRRKDYQLTVMGPKGKYTMDRPANVTFRGSSLQNTEAEIRLTVDDEFLYGWWRDGNEIWYIEPLFLYIPGSSPKHFVVYRQQDVKQPSSAICQTDAYSDFGWQSKPDDSSNTTKIDQCYTVPVALAADFSIRETMGSVTNTVNYMLGVLNNMHSNFDDEFADEINFHVVTSYVVDCAACDPWTSSTNVNSFLDDFRDWGNDGGFGNMYYALATCWTERDFDGTPIGAAYVGGVCNTGRYNTLQHFSNNAALLRVLNAHEIGHNFGASHDLSGSNTIMAPSVNTATEWSAVSENIINNSINAHGTASCFYTCTPPPPPVGAISASATDICIDSPVAFFDLSTNDPDTWLWNFPGGQPATSTQQHPTVVYAEPGSYAVTLQVSNVSGKDTVEWHTDISVGQTGPHYLLLDSFEGDSSQWSIDNPDEDITWQLADVGGTLGGNRAMYVDNFNYFYLGEVDALLSPVLDFSDETGMVLEFDYAYRRYSSSLQDKLRVYLSTDGGDTYPHLLFVGEETGNGGFATAPDSDDFFRPTTTDEWCFGADDFGPSCISIDLSPYSGESQVRLRIENETGYGNSMYVDNIALYADCAAASPPVALFNSNLTTGCAPLSVQFTDASTGGIGQRLWSFPGGQPASSVLAAPQVSYAVPGVYDVQLFVSNAAGTDALLKTDYIEVGGIPSAFFQTQTVQQTVYFDNLTTGADTFVWEFGDGNTSNLPNPTHTYTVAGAYTARLTASNSCGSNIYEVNLVIDPPLQANFTAEATTGCAALSVQFTDSSLGQPTSWQWTFVGGVPATSNAQHPLVDFPEQGTYDVQLKVTDQYGADSLLRMDYIMVNDAPSANFIIDYTPLQNEVFVSSTAVGATNITWAFATENGYIDLGSGQTAVYSYYLPGTYSIRQIAENQCGRDTVYQEVNVVLPDILSVATDSCAPVVVQYTVADPLPNRQYVWYHREQQATQGVVDTGLVSDMLYDSAGVYDVILEMLDTSGLLLVRVEYPARMQVAEAPQAAFALDYTLGSRTISLYENGQYADSLHWHFSDGHNASGNNVEHTFAADGWYQIDLFSFNDCGQDSSRQEVHIITAPEPEIEFVYTQPCAPGTISFYASPPTGTGGIAYNWFFEGASPSILSGDTVEVFYPTPGIFNVTLSAHNAAGSSTINKPDLVEIQSPFAVDFAIAYQVGELTIGLTANSPGVDSLHWDFGDGSTGNGAITQHSYQAAGQYTITLSAFHACGHTEVQQSVAIITPPVAGISATFNEGCAPLQVAFSALNQDEDYTYQWSFAGGEPQSSTEPNPSVTFSTIGSHDVSLTVSNAAGADQIIESNYIMVSPGPTASFATSVDAFTLHTTNHSLHAENYVWHFGDGDTSHLAEPSHTYPTNGIYELQLIATNGCGTDTVSQLVTIDESLPLVQFSANLTHGCAPLSVQFTDETQTGQQRQWSFPGGIPATSSEANPTVIYPDGGQFNVSLVVTNQAGSSALSQTNFIDVQAAPQSNFLFAEDQLTVSFIDISLRADTHLWHFGDGHTSALPNPLHTYQENGQYEVQLMVGNTCGFDTLSQVVTVMSAMPMAAFTANVVEGCSPLSVQFSSSFEGAVDSVLWIFEGGTPTQSTDLHPTVMYQEEGIYDVALFAANALAEEWVDKTEYIKVEANNPPEVGNIGVGQDGAQLLFLVTATGNGLTYHWDFGDGVDTITSSGSVQHVYAMTGLYRVVLTVENECGSIKREVQINVIINETAEPDWANGITIYPNPAFHQAWLGLKDWPGSGEICLRWYDMLGRLLRQRYVRVRSGNSQEVLFVSDLAPGLYGLEISWQGEKIYRRMVKH